MTADWQRHMTPELILIKAMADSIILLMKIAADDDRVRQSIEIMLRAIVAAVSEKQSLSEQGE